MSRLRIVVNEYYFYENELVKVVGAKGMESADTTRYLVQWGDNQGRACQAEVTRQELSAAPTLERLHHDYRSALNAICAQANRIEELEAKQTLFEQVMTISPRYVARFNGTPSSEGVFLAFNREHKEFLEACDELQADRAQVKILSVDDLKNTTEGFQNYYRRNVAHEAADVLVTIGGILAYLGIEWAQFEQACRQTIDKLDKRTDEHYAWDGKTVQHKSKIGAQS